LGEFVEGFLEESGVADSGRHEEKLGLGEGEERDLPSDAAFMVGVVVELVHDDLVDFRLSTFTQGKVGEDFGGAADDGSVGINSGVARDHADVFRAEGAAEGDELLVGESFDGDGVVGDLSGAERFVVQGKGDE